MSGVQNAVAELPEAGGSSRRPVLQRWQRFVPTEERLPILRKVLMPYRERLAINLPVLSLGVREAHQDDDPLSPTVVGLRGRRWPELVS